LSKSWKYRFHSFGLIFYAIRDFLIPWLPTFVVRLLVKRGAFAFLIHPQNLTDVQKKFPFAKYFSSELIEKIIYHLPPLIGSQITGLKRISTDHQGGPVDGYIVICPLSAKQMHRNPKMAKKRILQTVKFSEKLGAKIIGLGALTASMTDGGVYLSDKVKCGITTGHAYTTAIIVDMLEGVAKIFERDLSTLSVAVVGAAGYMGNPVSRLIAKKNPGRLFLVDRQRKKQALEKLAKEISDPRKEVVDPRKVVVSINLLKLKEADIVIVVTNSLEVIIKSEHLKPGAVVLDDTAPRNTSMDLVIQRPDILILDVMAQAPDVLSNFNFKFPLKHDIYTCLGEALILGARNWEQNYAIGHFDYGLVEEVSKWGQELGFGIAPFRSFSQLVTLDKINRIKAFYKNTTDKPRSYSLIKE
jgi:fatty aldehyde-generating acyl-ACP reductase